MALGGIFLFGVLFSIVLDPAYATTTLTSSATGPLVVGRDSVALYCRSQIPNADYLWNLDGEALPGDNRYQITTVLSKANSTLTISPVSMNDTGNFTCEAISGSTTETSNAVRLTLTSNQGSSPVDIPDSSSRLSGVAIHNIVIGFMAAVVLIRVGAPL
ncbi:carcinoembryonic antigen-related cell adhesion molecule 6-like [Hyperolius riggenbachi]|uniref:carcinoembryonic antigen-related cell adhesion molecule 6-like n=1 Tax=Hyperolius riggenbachi TaxID=752182 RepID=UPI0035A3127D